MTNQEKRLKRLIIRWTAPKGFAAMLLFLASALLLEYFVVYSFLSAGLTDGFTWIDTFQVPYVNWNFALVVSPLFHLLPLSVTIVLISSWIFLTRHVAFIPHRTGSTKKTVIRGRQTQRRRFKFLTRFSKRISKTMQKTGKALKNTSLRIPGFSKLSRRLFFARTAIRSAVTILLAFVSFSLLAFSLAYPWWIHDAIVNLYRENPFFLSFVIEGQESLQSLAQALTPIEWLATTMNNALLAAAPSFRSSLQSFGASTKSIAELDITGKYLLVQNLAAWICAIIALVHGKYSSTRRYKTR